MTSSGETYSRFTLTDADRYSIAQIQQEAPELSFTQAQMLHEFRHKSYGITSLQPPDTRFCEQLEKRLARAKAERIIPLRRANENGGHDRSVGADRKREPPATDAAPPPELVRLDLARYDTEQIPEREWGVRDRFPRRAVCLLSGEGAVGKSLLLLQLAVAHVLGRDWLRSMPEQGPVLLVNCEDEGDELVRRLDPNLKNRHTKFSDIAADLHVFSLANQDPLLALPDRSGRIVPTPLYAKLLELARTVQPICIVIDNVADVFGGSEIDRSQVRQFVALMRQIAIAANGYVIMSSHPSLAGIASKTGLSGSTQWHNSVRARAYMHENDDQSGTRVLEFMKSNYSALSERVELVWQNGLYVPVRAPSAPEQAATRAKADALFLSLLEKFTRKGENVSAKSKANNYGPTLFARTPEAKTAHLSREDLAEALDRLIAADQVVAEPYGSPTDDTRRLVRRPL
jgi:AAA domain